MGSIRQVGTFRKGIFVMRDDYGRPGPESSKAFFRRLTGKDDSDSESRSLSRRSRRLRGMSNPESGSTQIGLRRSARLAGMSPGTQIGSRRSARLAAKSARTMSQSTQLAAGKPRKPSRCSSKRCEFAVYWGGDFPIDFTGYRIDTDKMRRNTREANAKYFQYAYQNVYDKISDGSLNIKERKHILASNRIISQDNNDKSHGIMWVAVHGVKSICAVFKNARPDMKRVLDLLGDRVILTYFGKYVLSEMEDLADSGRIVRGKPFAVVSITPGTGNVVEEKCYEASGDMVDEERAIEILKVGTDGESPLTNEETIQTAISAFHHLFKEKLKPEEIWGSFFQDSNSYDIIRALSTDEIKKHLDESQRKCSPIMAGSRNV